METERREIYRYLGYGNKEPDQASGDLIEECVRELEAAAAPKFFHRTYPLTQLSGNRIDFGFMKAESRNLTKNLKDCDQVIVFAATIGAGVDLLIKRYNRLQMSKAVIMQAAAAAMIESFCDEKNGELKADFQRQGLYLRPRFSPGYGDFSLEHQRDIVGALEAGKRVGITLTDSLLMVPTKSVTAIIGVSHKEHLCDIHGCEACAKTDCIYRRG